MRRRKSAEDLTNLVKQAIQSRRGRPTALSDAQLHNRRDELLQTFEGAWGEIGWELLKCRKAEDLIRIFHPLAENYLRAFFSVLCHPSTMPPFADDLRKIRAEWRAIAEPRRNTDEEMRQALEKLKLADGALAQVPKSKRRFVRQARKKRRKEAWQAVRQYRNSFIAEHRIEEQLHELEASFARQELFRFLKSKRYALTPSSLANAAANLPYTGWRQSMRRCKKVKSKIANGLFYQIFKSIRYLVATANKMTENNFVTSFRDFIPLLPRRYKLPRVELAENWFYLERAIRQVYRTKLHPKALPFEITKRYLKQTQFRSQVDTVLAEQAKLSLSKEPSATRPQNKN